MSPATRAPACSHSRIAWYRNAVLSCAFAIGWVGGCAPSEDRGECSEDNPCSGRGEVCDLTTYECVEEQVDLSSTGVAEPNFTDKVVAMHRGRVCLVHEVQSGMDIPVTLDPCLHPCLTIQSFKHLHYYSCLGSSCDAWALMHVVATGANCPADAFGAFDRTMCSYTNPVELSIGTTINDGEPVSGVMTLEIPFFSNEDAQVIAASGNDTDLAKQKIEAYPQQDNRIAGGMDISLLPSHPAPPAACNGDESCTCYDFGF